MGISRHYPLVLYIRLLVCETFYNPMAAIYNTYHLIFHIKDIAAKIYVMLFTGKLSFL